MKHSRILLLIARSVWGLFILMTSFYCILAYIPFTYFHFLQFSHMAWLTAFVKIHPYLYWLMSAIVAATLKPALARPQTKKLTLAFFAFQALCGIALLIHPLLAHLRNDLTSFVWSLVALVPLLWVAAIDYIGHRGEIEWAEAGEGEDQRIFKAAVLSGLFVSLLYIGIFYCRYMVEGDVKFGKPEQVVAIAWSIISHLLIFVAVFVLLNLIRAVAGLFKRATKAEFYLCSLFVSVLIALTIRDIILSAVSFNGFLAHLFSFALAGSVVAFFACLGVRLYRADDGPVTSGLALVCMALTFGRIATYAARTIWILAITAVASILATKTVVMDWNFMGQKLSVTLVWSVTFASFYGMTAPTQVKRRHTAVLLALALVTLIAYKALDSSQARVATILKDSEFDVGQVIDRYSGMDVSFKLVREILTPSRGGGSFYSFLHQNTNIPRTTEVKPVDINLVEKLERTEAVKPNIFIFTVDSLRQDYLSPYNKAVTFTSSIDAFARESIVMENAFTRYGATGLAEPSIWVGGMLLHKQYITPFYPMNSLQKLIEFDQYQSFISLDTILSVIVKPSSTIVELDKGASDKDYEFCRTLKDLQSKIDKRTDAARPMFAYSQPQNIHVSVINREGKSVTAGEDYPGFYAPYASRIKRMDACFGEFIQYLKSRGLYDNSIIVLTADHGDSLGEEGRWGHAYTIFPEIIRIPLIIHLPPSLQKRLVWDTKRVAFSTDITPSLYYLLGHRPIVQSEVLGRPLFTETQQEQARYVKPHYLVASSYGAVYGILSGDGRWLYVADGINYVDYFYDMQEDPETMRNRVTSSIKAENENLMRDSILMVNRFYKFGQIE